MREIENYLVNKFKELFKINSVDITLEENDKLGIFFTEYKITIKEDDAYFFMKDLKASIDSYINLINKEDIYTLCATSDAYWIDYMVREHSFKFGKRDTYEVFFSCIVYTVDVDNIKNSLLVDDKGKEFYKIIEVKSKSICLIQLIDYEVDDRNNMFCQIKPLRDEYYGNPFEVMIGANKKDIKTKDKIVKSKIFYSKNNQVFHEYQENGYYSIIRCPTNMPE